MNSTDEVAAKTELTERQSAGAVAGSDDVLRKFDERFRATLKDFQRTSDQRGPVEDLHSSDDKSNKQLEELNERLEDLLRPGPQREPVEDWDDVLSGISHRLDNGTAERGAIYDRLLAIENEMKRRGSRSSRGFARYLVAICIGVATALAWQSYSEATKQIIATRAPELGWSPDTKQMIASWVQQLGWTKPPPGHESTAVQPFVPETPQAAPAAENAAPKAPVAPSIDPEQAHQITLDLAALRQTVKQLAGQMASEITKLQSADQEILEKIPAPAPPRPIATPAHKPGPITSPSARAPIPPPHP
jgi:hypothetical protein